MLFSLSSSDSESEPVPDSDPDPDICQSSLYILNDKRVIYIVVFFFNLVFCLFILLFWFFFKLGIHPQGICCNVNILQRNKNLVTVIPADETENCHQ